MSVFSKLPIGKQAVVGLDYDSAFEGEGIDAATESLHTIDYSNHQVNAGRSFRCSDVVSVSTTTQLWLITTKNIAKKITQDL